VRSERNTYWELHCQGTCDELCLWACNVTARYGIYDGVRQTYDGPLSLAVDAQKGLVDSFKKNHNMK